MKKHLAIMNKVVIEAVLAGTKTIETRFSKHRISPFGQVRIGDLVYMKPPGEEIVGMFRVKKVISLEGIEPDDMTKLFRLYSKFITSGNKDIDQKYWLEKENSNFGTLIFIGQSERFLTSPVKFIKHDLRGWVVLLSKDHRSL